MVVLDAQAITM